MTGSVCASVDLRFIKLYRPCDVICKAYSLSPFGPCGRATTDE